MHRDMVLIRKVLEYVEENGKPGASTLRPDFEGYEKPIVNYHVDLCAEAEFIRFKKDRTLKGPDKGKIESLTWKGHEFLDSLRSG